MKENVRKLFRITHADQKIMILDARQDALAALLGQIPAASR
jgi:hypothetical protein